MPDAEPEGPKVTKHRLAPALRWFFTEGAGTLVALAAGAVAVFFTVFPDLKPFSATTKTADIGVIAVERGVTRDEWRWRLAAGDRAAHDKLVSEDRRVARRSADEPCHILGDQPGYSVYVRTNAEGFKRRELTIRARLYAYPSRRQIRLGGTEGERYRPLARVPVDAPSAGSVQEIWVFDPGAEAPRPQYFVRVVIYDPQDQMLDVVDSPHFFATADSQLADVAGGCRPP